MATTIQLPGVTFRTETQQPSDVLPRMDIAAFVGFAAAGPLHTPVPVEDLGRFRDLFGDDLPLAWDDERGQTQTAQLGPAVEAFFRNGGRRCWIVRVADEERAFLYRFPLPGLVTAGNKDMPAEAWARSPGTWPRELRVGTVLESDRFLFSDDGAVVLRPGDYSLDLVASPKEIRAGDLLEVRFDGGSLVLYLFVESAEVEESGLRVAGSQAFWFEAGAGEVSPPDTEENGPPELFSLTETEGLSLALALLDSSPAARLSVWRLSFQILVWQGSRIRRRLRGLTFHVEHPRYWGRLPSDAALFELRKGRSEEIREGQEDALRREASDPRFPLAAPGGLASAWLPLGMISRPDATKASEPIDEPVASDLEANGVDQFTPSLFLDPDLEGETWGSLLNEARHKYYVRLLPLRGVHSLLPVEEVSMIAAPDLTQRGWWRQPPPAAEVLEAPYLHPIPDPDASANYLLAWTAVEGATRYCLERASSPCFTNTVAAYEGAANETVVRLPEECRGEAYFRVRAFRFSERSSWSNTRGRLLPPELFEACQKPAAGILELTLEEALAGSPEGDIELFWTPDPSGPEGAAEAFEVQEAGDADFAFPETHRVESATHFLTDEPQDSVRYFRVRAVAGERKGSWSNTVALFPTSRLAWALAPETEYAISPDGEQSSPQDTLLAVQRALIRFCAARADVVAVLGFPRHYRREEVLKHLSSLLPQQRPLLNQTVEAPRTAVPRFTLGESPAFGYAALYHPWVAVVRQAESESGTTASAARFLPPEGPVCGTIAARTMEQGAWVAPANIPIAGALALDPDFDLEQWAELTAAQVNLLVEDPRGYLAFNAETLSRENDFRQLNVRRLMILLRRLALRHGATYVFEPNDADFRDRVRDRFERLLSGMYVRGAFAGTTAEEGFRVVADDTINPRQSIALGRFVVELRVAPSRPMAYLHVRLIQSGPEQLTVQEV